MTTPLEQFKREIVTDDLAATTAALRHDEVRKNVDSGIFACRRPPLLEAPSP